MEQQVLVKVEAAAAEAHPIQQLQEAEILQVHPLVKETTVQLVLDTMVRAAEAVAQAQQRLVQVVEMEQLHQ
jgi:hypothetical protein